ncbi:MAG TPA: hypothetical protein DCZ04_11410 [Syntrophorhabdus aromaticivorans]|nr:hypothetical protein [Syntrophorhabdus aromaticivorans]
MWIVQKRESGETPSLELVKKTVIRTDNIPVWTGPARLVFLVPQTSFSAYRFIFAHHVILLSSSELPTRRASF